MNETVTITFKHDGTPYGTMNLDVACHHLAKSLLNKNTMDARYEMRRRLQAGEKINTIRLSYELKTT